MAAPADGLGFTALVPTVERLLGAGPGAGALPERALPGMAGPVERLVLVLLDGFGWRFFERHAEGHPLLRRLAEDGTVTRLTTQFPSTTTAHVTTLHTGQTVGEHGLYEWHLYEPSLDAVVTPLTFSFAGDDSPGTLSAAGADPRLLYPTATLYHRLAARGVASHTFQPAKFAPSTYDSVVLDGASMHAYDTLPDGLAQLTTALRRQDRPMYAYLYSDIIDTVGHRHGPSSAEFDDAIAACLDAVEAALADVPSGTLLLLAADHGQVDVDPASTVYVDELWPEIERHLRRGADGRPLAPAGSPRDFFLHVLPGSVETVIARLGELLAGRAEVHATRDLAVRGLFGPVLGPRLRERLADVCVLPAARETVWWREGGRFEMRFLGHHGGLAPEETETIVAALAID